MGSKDVICETCYRSPKVSHPRDHLLLQYKHCILRREISPETSRKICHCPAVSQHDANGGYLSLFPVDQNEPHRSFGEAGYQQCGLLSLGKVVAEAKYEGLLGKLDKKKDLNERKKMDQEYQAKKHRKEEQTQSTSAKKNRKANPKATVQVETALRDPLETEALVRDEGSGVPIHLRRAANKYPFGKVHMSLMFGPLRIENGVPG